MCGVDVTVSTEKFSPLVFTAARTKRLYVLCEIRFAPNVFTLRYIKSVGAQLKDLESKALRHINIGYQRELKFMHRDGSFSAFGPSDGVGSSWLTAFVIKCFVQAQTYTSFEV